MTKSEWKMQWRLLRIIRREAAKAHFDAMIYGTGFVRVDGEFVNHVRPEAIWGRE